MLYKMDWHSYKMLAKFNYMIFLNLMLVKIIIYSQTKQTLKLNWIYNTN